jgi:hypothetical protein
VTAATVNSYTIQAVSKSGNIFQIAKDSSGNITRDCGNPAPGVAANRGQGGCHSTADSQGNYW